MANQSEFDFFKIHIKGVRQNTFPLHYAPLPKVHYSSSPTTSKRAEAMFKIVSYIKSPFEAKNCMAYLSLHSENLPAPKPLIDQYNNDIPAPAFNDKLSDLNLVSKFKNEHLMVHFILSFPKGHELNPDDISPFTHKYMEPFAKEGYDYLFCPHSHQSRQHIHVLLKLNNGHHRLRFLRKQCNMMRQHQVEIAKEFGITLTATRCQDRTFTLDTLTAHPVKKTLLERQLPHFYARRKSEGHTPKTISFNLDDHPSLDEWASSFKDPNRARQLFLEMYIEKPKTAFWYANHLQKIFGETLFSPSKINKLNFDLSQKEVQQIQKVLTPPREQSLGMSL